MRSPFDGAPARGPFEPGGSVLASRGFTSRVEELEAAIARGERADAYQLFEYLARCAHVHQLVDGETERCDRGGRLCDRPKLEELKGIRDECSAIGPDRVGRRQRYLDMAASWGDVRAQSFFGLYPPEALTTSLDAALLDSVLWADWTRRRITYLRAAADRGSVPALAGLWLAHSEDGALPDPVSALAYYLAWSETERRGMANAADRERLAQRLDAAQLREANLLRDRILARCCKP
jgi:hypothetical protein